MLKLVGIKSGNGVLISDSPDENKYSHSNIGGKLFDGTPPQPTYHKNWFLIQKEPCEITVLVNGKQINHRYELKDLSLESDKFKASFLKDDVSYIDDDYELCFKNGFGDIHSLYSLVSDKEEDHYKRVEFEYVQIMEIDEIPNIEEFSYPAQLNQWRHKGMSTVTEKDVNYQIIDKILFPSPILPSRPCSLTSKKSYEIVREFIKLNIDPIYAEITSDYNFCFTVKKKIPLAEPEKYTVDVNNGIFQKRKRKPKIETRFRKTRSVQIFEMTNSDDKYKGYTVLDGFTGDSSEELANNINKYLENVISEINKPIVDCPHCKGLGVVNIDSIKTNK